GSAFTHEQQATTRQNGQQQQQGPPPVAILTYRVWRDLFGSDPQIVGKSVRFTELAATVVGVGPRDLDVPRGARFWMKARLHPQDVGQGLGAVLRVKPGTTLPRLRSELAVTMSGLGRDFPVADAGRDFVAQPLVAAVVGDLGPTLLVVFAATTL